MNFGHYIRRSQALGYGISDANLSRIGNIVIVSRSVITSQDLPTTESTLLETIPSGFRPASGDIGTITGLSGSTSGAFATWYVANSGSMHIISKGLDWSGAKRINILGVWITQDEWPN